MLAGLLMTMLISLTTAAGACMDGDSETCHTKYGTRFGHDLLPRWEEAAEEEEKRREGRKEGKISADKLHQLHACGGLRQPQPRFFRGDASTCDGGTKKIPRADGGAVREGGRRNLLTCGFTRPDQWFRDDYFICVNEAREAIAKYVKAPSTDDIVRCMLCHEHAAAEAPQVLVENASGGVNAVLRSMVWEDGDVVLFLSSAYPMVKNTAVGASSLSGLPSLHVLRHGWESRIRLSESRRCSWRATGLLEEDRQF